MLNDIRKISTFLLSIFVIIELFLFPGIENLFGAVVILYGWILLVVIIIRKEVLEQHPAIFMVSLGVGTFYYYMPLATTLLAQRPITYQFEVPYKVFFHQAVYVSVYVFAFFIYHKSHWRPNLIKKGISKLKFYAIPTNAQLWMMGGVGIMAYLVIRIQSGVSTDDNQEASSLVTTAKQILYFIYAPVLIAFRHLYDRQYSSNKLDKKVLLYILAIVIMSLFGNSRQFMISTLLLFMLILFLETSLYTKSISEILTIKNVLIILTLGYIIMGPFARMANAMVMVRGIREEVTASELFKETLSAYRSKELDVYLKSKDYREADNYNEWEEDYTGNVFFDRFCNLRIVDVGLAFSDIANMSKSETWILLQNSFIYQLPSPIIKFLGINFDKNNSSATSTMSSQVTNRSYGDYHGRKLVASHVATGLWLFGGFYPIIFFLFYLVLFYLFDIFHFSSKGKPVFSVLMLINLYDFFTFLNFKNGIVSDMIFTGRPLFQMIIIYSIVFYITSLIDQKLRFVVPFIKYKRRVNFYDSFLH